MLVLTFSFVLIGFLKSVQGHVHDPLSHSMTSSTTSLNPTVRVSRGGAFYPLPDPVTCFKHASYDQLQIFRLEDGASPTVPDSFTSGRKSFGVLEIPQGQQRVHER